jgi:hypothetical protein
MNSHHKYIKYKTKYLELKNNLSGGAKIEAKIYPDLSLIRDHGVDGSFYKWKKELKTDPDESFCIKFYGNNKTLYYIGALHTIDPNSKTFSYVNKVITKFKPDIVLIEGVPLSKGINPQLDYFQGEGKYAAELATKYQIPFSGIEGNDNDMDNIILKLSEKYDIDDIYGYFYLGMHKYMAKTMKATKNEFIHDFDEYERKHLDDLFKTTTKWIPEIWFSKTFGKKFKYGSFLEYSAPYDNPKIITQRISFDYGKLRDQINAKNLYIFINDYNTILYIMGQNHLYADFPMLLDTFGHYELVF